MKQKIQETLENSFFQLIIIYSLIVLAIALGFLWKYSFQFQIFAFVLSLFGISLLCSSKFKEIDSRKLKLPKKIHVLFFIIAILVIIFIRTLPYITNTIPLGYDAGIYKYAIEYGTQNLDQWILNGGIEPGFLYLTGFLKQFFSSQFILTYLLIFFCTILGGAIYFLVKTYSDKSTALIAIFLYAFSLIQFRTFWFMYYKNIVGMILILASLIFLKKYEITKKRKLLFLFILTAGIINLVHRPCFYIFGISYLFYAFISPYSFEKKSYSLSKLKLNVLWGILIILIGISFYIGKFWPSLASMFFAGTKSITSQGQAPGTFINFFTYQFSSLVYLPFSLLGVYYFLRKKQINILVIWTIINLSLVYFQFYGYNRAIIFLDLILIIMASFGLGFIMKKNKKIGISLVILLIFSAGVLSYSYAKSSSPLITPRELDLISEFNSAPENAYAMATSSIYSPWVLGYSNRKTIAPGLFDYDVHNKAEWIDFWTTSNLTNIKHFLEAYERPIYIHIGEKQRNNLIQFNESDCFRVFSKNDNNFIYEYIY